MSHNDFKKQIKKLLCIFSTPRDKIGKNNMQSLIKVLNSSAEKNLNYIIPENNLSP
ncbi:hypothetical protein CWI36_0029p0030 [Hamiltosporidium magnivora]|uniref:Uncharacterized protein n=1 Tax=Hamiltosporidium magnivora TaxID=148818 RepID=A0A4Q9LM62_9MICR|nr:hypothetical protein CWI36_0029p0030 [Hamiltosporidium magnivora]